MSRRIMFSMKVADYYAGKSIFITGATGFLGKVSVEKLIRCCPEVKKIYLLMRPKKGQDATERLQELIKSRIFERVRTECPNNLNKLHVISGDILQDGLGISVADRKELAKECNVVFHAAASVRFDMTLRDAVNTNIVGTKRVLELAAQMSKLDVFLHISTAYCHSGVDVIEEKVYPSKDDPQDVIAGTRWFNEQSLNLITDRIIDSEPNTYGYTKSLAEVLVAQYAEKFTIAIVRPSIVVATLNEPMPGWVDSMQGLTGLIAGTLKGVIRSINCKPDIRPDLIPVDFVVNGCIVVAFKTGIEKAQGVQVYNITNSNRNSLSWREYLMFVLKNNHKYPYINCLWYPNCALRNSLLIHKVDVVLFHYLPAYLIDLLLFLLGKKTFMVRVQNKISQGLSVLYFYATRDWHFKNDNFLSLPSVLCPADRKTFNTDVTTADTDYFIEHYVKGIREYYFKEDPANISQAKKILNRLYYADVGLKVIVFFIIMYLLYNFMF